MATSEGALTRLDDSRLTGFHRYVMILISLGEFIDGYDLIVMGGALLFLVPQFHLTPSQTGLLGAAAFLGAAFGALVFGNMTDRVGRRTIFIFNLILFVVCAILSGLVADITQLFIMRVLIGVAVGADIPTSMAFLAEVAPKNKRGAWMGFLPNITWTLGAATSVFVALLLRQVAGPEAWRWMFGLAAVPAILVLLGRRRLPESPRWLLKQGRVEEARAALERFGISNPDVTTYQPQVTRWRELFESKLRARTLLSSLVYGLNCFTASIATIAAPFIFHYVGAASVESSLLFSGIVWIIAFFGVLTGFALTDRIGRRRLALLCWIPLGITGILMGLFGVGRPTVLVPLYIIFGFANWIGSGCNWAWPAELLPTRVRGASVGVSNVFCRVALAAAIFVVPVGTAALGFGLTAVLMSLPVFVNAIIVSRVSFFEAKGLSLEELTQ